MASLEADEFVGDPDTLKMPENPRHRRVCELVGMLAGRLLGSGSECFRDMNWYPPDGGQAIAPDVFVLPAGTLEAGRNSYRQTDDTAPYPTVAVEVPSRSDGWISFRARMDRYQRLGVVLYVIEIDGVPARVLRLEPTEDEPERWEGRPIPELGGLSIEPVDGDVVVRSPDGELAASSPEELLAEWERRSHAAIERAEILAERLRALGENPDLLT